MLILFALLVPVVVLFFMYLNSRMRFVLFDSGTYTAYATTLREMQDADTTIT